MFTIKPGWSWKYPSLCFTPQNTDWILHLLRSVPITSCCQVFWSIWRRCSLCYHLLFLAFQHICLHLIIMKVLISQFSHICNAKCDGVSEPSYLNTIPLDFFLPLLLLSYFYVQLIYMSLNLYTKISLNIKFVLFVFQCLPSNQDDPGNNLPCALLLKMRTESSTSSELGPSALFFFPSSTTVCS